MEALEGGVAPNWKANERLNDLQVRKASPSFLQLRGRKGGKQDAKQKVMHVLDIAAAKLKSSVLALASLRVQVSEDHFVKVRALMKDLIEKLEADAASEMTAKAACDKDIKEAVTERDASQIEVEKLNAEEAELTTNAKMLSQKIAELSEEIAQNKKAVMEAEELRGEEKQDNELNGQTAKDGLAAVEKAIEILEQFYTHAATALVQKRKQMPTAGGMREDELRFASTNSSRDGLTVADKAPDVFDDTYKGQQEASKGIIGTLQVIKEDFMRQISQTENDEATAAQEHSDFLGEMSDENDELEDYKSHPQTGAEAQLTITNDAILDEGKKLSAATKEVTLAKKTLDGLKAGCIDKDETYEERVDKRNQEIEALKEAHDILENWEDQ